MEEYLSIASFASAIVVPVGIASSVFSSTFSLTRGIIKKLLKTTQNRKKINIVTLAKSKLNSTETLTSKALIDCKISHEKYAAIINEEEKYRRMEADIRIMKSQRSDAEKDELNGKSKKNQNQ